MTLSPRLRRTPPEDYLPALKADYEHMKNMIFGETPEFEVILAVIVGIEGEINSL